MTTRDASTMENEVVPLSETLGPVLTLLGGVPVATALVMSAVRYVTSGTF